MNSYERNIAASEDIYIKERDEALALRDAAVKAATDIEDWEALDTAHSEYLKAERLAFNNKRIRNQGIARRRCHAGGRNNRFGRSIAT